MERLHDRDFLIARAGESGQAARPADGVHNVGLLPAPEVGELGGERAHVRKQHLVGQGLGRPGGYVLDVHSAWELTAVGQARCVLAREQGHVMLLLRELAGQRGHTSLLASRLGVQCVHERASLIGY
jgi:hypothetical protein